MRHGRSGPGNSFVLSDGNSILTYPNFTATQNIRKDCDLRLELKPMSDADWEIANYLCDGGSSSNCNFDDFGERLDYVNLIFNACHGGCVTTQLQRKKRAEELKKALGHQNSDIIPEEDLDKSCDKGVDIPLNTLDDRYNYEGAIDEALDKRIKYS